MKIQTVEDQKQITQGYFKIFHSPSIPESDVSNITLLWLPKHL